MTRKKRQNKPAVPKGNQFMENTVGTDDIKATLNTEQEKNGQSKAVFILLACLWRRQGENGTRIASRLNVNTSTVYDWLSRMHRNGLDARYDKTKPGRPRKANSKLHKAVTDATDKQPKK